LKLRNVAFAVALGSLVAAAGTVPAQATERIVNIADAEATISAIAPNILGDTYLPSSGTAARQATTADSELVTHIPSRGSEAVRFLSMDQNAAPQMSVKIGDAAGTVSGTGISVIPSTDSKVFNYVQPTRNGIRFLTAFDRGAVSTNFSYTFDVPVGTTAQPISNGRLALMPPKPVDNRSPWIAFGVINAPWAVDSAGNALPTHYGWSGTTLTQYVEPSATTTYPVLADPNWSYDFYDNLRILYTPHDVMNNLHACFNCEFPISGAPSKYPAVGDTLNLNASPFSFISIPAPVQVSNSYDAGTVAGFGFTALAGHFDGAGSIVQFTFDGDRTRYLSLEVMANVVVDRGAVANAANTLAAEREWGIFGQNVVNTLTVIHAR